MAARSCRFKSCSGHKKANSIRVGFCIFSQSRVPSNGIPGTHTKADSTIGISDFFRLTVWFSGLIFLPIRESSHLRIIRFILSIPQQTIVLRPLLPNPLSHRHRRGTKESISARLARKRMDIHGSHLLQENFGNKNILPME